MLDRLDLMEDATPLSAPLNMAVDEALLETATCPTIRFYRWAGPALSFGYFGELTEARAVGEGRELVRRWTGGGIVPHGNDLTYSLILPAAHASFVSSARAIYGAVHAALRDVFRQIGIETELAQAAAPRISDACFANPVFADLMVGDRKVAGAAQRRTRAGLLQQGSIQFQNLSRDLGKRLAGALASSITERASDGDIMARAEELSAQKYGTLAWLERR
jgi:lipoate-protein ligase A